MLALKKVATGWLRRKNEHRQDTQHIKLDERNHVEKPLLHQLAGLGWEIIDLDNEQHPADSHRQNFNEVVMLPVLRE